MNLIEQCPCCGQKVELVGDGVLESHIPIVTPSRERPKRAGIWCDGSGYTVEQAQRWSALTDDRRRELLAVRTQNPANTRAVA